MWCHGNVAIMLLTMLNIFLLFFPHWMCESHNDISGAGGKFKGLN